MNSKRNSVNGSVLTIGLDIGYSVTKVVTDDQVITFPSVCERSGKVLPGVSRNAPFEV